MLKALELKPDAAYVMNYLGYSWLERNVKINQALNEIGEPCKSILVYFFFNQLTMEEIAAKMGYTNADNVKNQKYKCFKRLKKLVLK